MFDHSSQLDMKKLKASILIKLDKGYTEGYTESF